MNKTLVVFILAVISLAQACGGGGGGGNSGNPSVSAHDRTWGTPQLIETETKLSSYGADAVINANGDAIVVWWTQSSDLKYNIWANNYTTEDGWGTPQLIGTAECKEEWFEPAPAVVMDAKGNAMTAWYSSYETYETKYNIWTNKFTAGEGWGTAEVLASDISYHNYYSYTKPPVSMNADGYAVVAWDQDSEGNVYATRYSPLVGWSAAQIIDNNDHSINSFPDIAIDANGNAVAAWAQSDLSYPRVWANYYTVDNGWNSKAKVILDPTPGDYPSSCHDPRVAMDANGNAIAACYATQPSSYIPESIWVNYYGAGADWGRQQLIAYFPDSQDYMNISLVMSANGNAMIIWGQKVDTYDILVSYYTTTENEWLAPKTIGNNNNHYYYLPRIAADANGNFIVVWADNYDHIRASHYAAGGKWEETDIGADESTTSYAGAIAMNNDGDAIVVWLQYDEKNGHDHIWANFYQ